MSKESGIPRTGATSNDATADERERYVAVQRRLLTIDEAAAYLGVSRRTFFRLRTGLPTVAMKTPGSHRAMPRYDVRDLDTLIDAKRVA